MRRTGTSYHYRDDPGKLRRGVPRVLAGEKFERWMVIKNSIPGADEVPCRCDCGTEKRVGVSALQRGTSRSCGCIRREKAAARAAARVRLRVPCSRPGCPALRALPDIDLCKGHLGDKLAGLSAAEFEGRIAEIFAGQFNIAGECWEFSGTLQGGYGRIQIRPDGIKQRIFVHHLVVQIRAGRPLNGFALHHCDDPPCFRPSHLYEGSHADNTADAVERNRTARGDRNPRTKLTPEQIREIFARHKPGQTRWDPGNACELAQEFGVDKNTINSLIRNGHWSFPEVIPAKRERKPVTRLTSEQIREIAARHQPGFTRWDRGNTAQLAQEFGVSKVAIGRIAQRERKSLQEAS